MNERVTITVADAIDAYHADLELQGRHITARNYAYSLVPLRRQHGELQLGEVDQAACRRLMMARSRELSANSLSTFYFVLRSFFTWSIEQGFTSTNPTDGLPRPPQKRPAHRWLDAGALRRMYQACDDDGERLIVLLLGGAGLRSAELRGLRWRDVNLEGATMRVFGKGRKWRELALDPLIVAVLARVLEAAGGRVHVTTFRGANALRYHVERIATRAGVGHAHAHMLRHSFAVNWLEHSDEDAGSLQALLGHSRSTMTEHYVRSVRAAAAVRKQRRVDLSGQLFGPAAEP